MVRILKNRIVIVVLIIMSVVFLCCKGSKSLAPGSAKSEPVLPPGNADIAIAQSHWSSSTLSSLTQGYNLYSDKCTQCHETKKPQDFTLDDWNRILPAMGKKAWLDSNEYNLVYHYIITRRETILAGKN
jgi:hypothetical protein